MPNLRLRRSATVRLRDPIAFQSTSIWSCCTLRCATQKAGLSPMREQDFEVYEDGVRQSIRLFRHEDIPVTVGLVVDHSGSMRQKLSDVMSAARTFVRSSSSQDQMFVVNFNEDVSLGLPAKFHLPTARMNSHARSPIHPRQERRRFTMLSSRREGDWRPAAATRKC